MENVHKVIISHFFIISLKKKTKAFLSSFFFPIFYFFPNINFYFHQHNLLFPVSYDLIVCSIPSKYGPNGLPYDTAKQLIDGEGEKGEKGGKGEGGWERWWEVEDTEGLIQFVPK